MKNKLFWLPVAALCLGLAACSNEPEDGLTLSANKITISPTITRATGMNFEEGDRIGLTMIKSDETYHAENHLLTFAGDVFTGNTTWYTESNEVSHLVAYHPYDESGAPTSFTVSLDQNGDGYGRSDLLGASKADVAPSASAVGMVFKHLLTKLIVNVTNEADADVSSVAFQGIIPTADIDLKGLSVEVDNAVSTAEITAQQVTENTLYRAIVVPQVVAMTLVVKTSDSKTLTQSLAISTLKQGAQYSVNVTVSSDGELKVTLSGEIFGWTDEGEISSAEEETSGKLHTITFEGDYWEPFVAVNYNGGTYTNVIHGNYTYPLWVDETTQLTTDYPTWFNDDRSSSMGFDYPWILSSYNTNNISPELGWYLTDLYIYNPHNADATTGGGRNGSNNFLVAFGYYEPDGMFSFGDYRPVFKFADRKARTIKSIYINSTIYFLSVVADGNDLSPALGEGDSVWWEATGIDVDGNEISSIRRTFASYEHVIKEWTEWDLSELGPIVALKLNQGGETDNGYGYSLPAYYAIDDITVILED